MKIFKSRSFKILMVLSLVILFSGQSVVLAVVNTDIGPNITTTGNLTVNGAVKFTSGATNNYILNTDALGNATWIPVGTALGNSDSDSLPEGALNLYYTDARADARITAQKGAASGLAPLDVSSLVPMANLPADVANGLATLDASGKIPNGQIPFIAIGNTFVVTNQADLITLTGAQIGDVGVVTSISKSFILANDPYSTASNWQELLTPTDQVLSVNGYTGTVVLTKSDVGLGNVENTALSTWAGSANITTLGTLTSASGNVSLWTNDAGYLTAETDPVAGAVSGIIKSNGAGVFSAVTDNSANWNTAYGWGNHALAGYLTSETDPNAVLKATFAANGDLLVGTGAGTYTNLAAGAGNNGKVLSVVGGVPTWAAPGAVVETDPVAGAVNGIIKSNGAGVFSAVADNSANWNTAFGWGNHATAGYLTSETDPNAVLKSIGTTKGDLVVFTGSGTPVRIGTGGAGNDNYVLTADSSQANGIKWAAVPSAPVSSVFGRTGPVTAQAGDYTKSDVGLGNVENTALSTWAGSANITTLGTIGTGTWNASTIGVSKGGTGLTSGTSGGILGFTAPGTLASSGTLTANALVLGGGAGATPTVLGSLGTTTTVLHGNAGGAPTFGAVALGSDVSGTLPIGNGGTGQTAKTAAFDALAPTTTDGDLIYHNGSNNVRLAVGSNGQCLTSNGTTLVWGSCGGTASALSSITAAGATNTIDNTNYAQTWNWSTASTQTPLSFSANALTSGKLLSLASSSTGLTGNLADLQLTGNNAGVTGKGLNINVSGASAAAVPLYINNNGAGLSFRVDDATGDTTPFVIDASGNVGIQKAAPGSTLDVGGILRLSGATSGYVGLQGAAAAGSTTYTLPSVDGTSGQSLTTNGSGVLSWATPAQGGATSGNYASTYNTTNLAVSAANTWTDVTFNNTPQLNGWTYGSGAFTVPVTGLYMVNYTLFMEKTSGGTAKTGEVRLYKNGTTVVGGSEEAASFQSNNVELPFNNSTIVSFTAGDTLKLQIIGETTAFQISGPLHKVNSTSPISASLSMTRVQ